MPEANRRQTDSETPEAQAIRGQLGQMLQSAVDTLPETYRSVFVLREVFDYEYDEIATILGKDPAACRQVFSRAKKHVAEGKPRFAPAPEAQRRLLSQFM